MHEDRFIRFVAIAVMAGMVLIFVLHPAALYPHVGP